VKTLEAKASQAAGNGRTERPGGRTRWQLEVRTGGCYELEWLWGPWVSLSGRVPTEASRGASNQNREFYDRRRKTMAIDLSGGLPPSADRVLGQRETPSLMVASSIGR
jgi:hypothetical protein